VFVVILLCGGDASTEDADAVVARVRELTKALREASEPALRACIAEEYFRLVPPESITAWAKSLSPSSSYGPIDGFSLRRRDTEWTATFVITTAKGGLCRL
jgi:hypothetical protein